MTTVTITCTDLEPYRGQPTSYFTVQPSDDLLAVCRVTANA